MALAASSSSFLSVLISLFSLITVSLSTHDSSTLIKLSLTPLIPKTSNTNPWQRLNHLTSSSLARAHNLKHPSHNSTNIPLSPQSYGGYSISLSFGSPPQTLSFVMDTGSSLVWFPCTHRYQCSDCNFVNVDPTNITVFIPKLSSSAMIVGCKNEKCGWIFGSDESTRCNNGQTCSPYIIEYGSGSTSGLLISDSLSFPEKNVPDFLVGCSISSSRQPSGIAGFGRGLASLPVQLGVKKFSYCLVSHRFDGASVSSDLVLETDSGSGSGSASVHKSSKSGGVISYTPLQKNPLTSNPAFQDYYYVTLRKITVGNKPVKVPYSYLVPGSDGNGGTIVDSGTTFTFMDSEAFEPVAKEFIKQMSQYNRAAAEVENEAGLRPCFNISGQETVSFPELVFHFKGGVKMALPLADFFSFYDTDVVCLTLISNNRNATSEKKFGPSIILGNYQQQNFYIEYDLENERIGFRQQACK